MTNLKIGIAADHGGFHLKEKIKAYLIEEGIQPNDFGASFYDDQDDYPDFVIPLGKAVAKGAIDRGIAVCGSGVGASIVANKIKGVKSALITETYSAHQGVEHDHMNIICIGGRVVGFALAWEIIQAFVKAEKSLETRHLRRIQKIDNME